MQSIDAAQEKIGGGMHKFGAMRALRPAVQPYPGVSRIELSGFLNGHG